MASILDVLGRAVPLMPAVLVVAVALAAVRLSRRIFTRRLEASSRGEFRVQIINLLISLTAMVMLLVVLPVDGQLRGQLLGLFGIVLSAAIALSSTTFIGNVMAGLMLKAVRNFHTGDFVRVGDQFGRVTTRGILSTEIQTEDRDLVTVPNLHLVTTPVRVVRASGTLISAEVSLAYDITHTRVEQLLEQAAADVDLAEPFVLVMALGDFSVTYRVAGLLTEVKHLLTARSMLRRAMLDRLHGDGVEIVSPTFMNQRVQPLASRVVAPPSAQFVPDHDEPRMEDLAFDKADEAESLEQLLDTHSRLRKAIAELADADDHGDPALLAQRQDILTRRLARIETAIAQQQEKADQDD